MLGFNGLQKPRNAPEVPRRVRVKGIAVSSLELHKRLRRRSGLVQTPSVSQRNDLVARRMKEELGDPDLRDFLQ